MVSMEKIGEYAFLGGVIIAIIAGAAAALVGVDTPTAGTITLVLVVLGAIVGLLNIKDKEVTTFLIAAIALVAVGSAQLNTIDKLIPTLGTLLQLIVVNIAVFVTPAALVVALKAVYGLASKPAISPLVK